MVTAIQNINPHTNHQQVNILFDKGLNLEPKTKICLDEQSAQVFIHKQYSFAIRTLLISFAKQQLFIAKKYPAMQGAAIKINAAETILEEMKHHEHSPLVVVTSVVYYLRACIMNLEPAPNSRYRARYDEFVRPLIDFCFNHSKKVRSQQLASEQTYRVTL